MAGSPLTLSAYLLGPTSAIINPAAIPTPSASTLGGVQSVAASPGEFINAISTTGVPSQSGVTYSEVNGPLVYPTKSVANSASPYSVGTTDVILAVSAGASSATVIDLPAATTIGRALVVKKVDANAQNVAVTPAGSDSIDGTAAVYNISTQYAVVSLVVTVSGQWSITSTYL